MASVEFLQYRIVDPFLTDIYGAPVTAQMRQYGVLLTDARAAWYVANHQLELMKAGPINSENRPVTPVLLSALFAPLLEQKDTGKLYIMQAFAGMLKLTQFDPQDRPEFDDPGDLTAIVAEAMQQGA